MAEIERQEDKKAERDVALGWTRDDIHNLASTKPDFERHQHLGQRNK